jgi:hypothetical protein
LKDAVLLREQHISIVPGFTAKFHRPYEGPYRITKTINPSTYEISGTQENLRGNILEETSETIPLRRSVEIRRICRSDTRSLHPASHIPTLDRVKWGGSLGKCHSFIPSSVMDVRTASVV